jgi:hypothetical protein
MSLSRRLLSAAVCLAVGVLAQAGLRWHLRSAEISPFPDLTASLASLPRDVANPLYEKASEAAGPDLSTPQGWRGLDHAGLDEFRKKLPYTADDLLSRRYFPYRDQTPSGPPLDLYIVYSRTGEDRKHHPEICIRDAAGSAEDVAARRQLLLDAAGERPVMRFRFRTGPAQLTTVYYWHYTLEAPPGPRQSLLQALYQRQSHPAPSVTVQVSLAAADPDLEAVEKGFLGAVDAALSRHHLPPTARIGCNRLPIALKQE